nr:unnamed protein product [Callosobruchus chinensis]
MEDNKMTNESDPFKRRESLKRTPPGRERSASMSDIIWQKKIGDPEASNPSKRRGQKPYLIPLRLDGMKLIG